MSVKVKFENNTFVPDRQSTDAQFFCLLENADTARALRCLEQGLNPNCKDSTGKTALVTTISLGNLQVFEKLLDYGADISTGNVSQFHDTLSQHRLAKLPTLLALDPITFVVRVMDYFDLATLPDALMFAFSTISFWQHICSFIEYHHLNRIHLHYLGLLCLIYGALQLISTFCVQYMATFATGILHSRSFLFQFIRHIMARGAFVYNLRMFVSRHIRQVKNAPGSKAIQALTRYSLEGGEQMLLFLLEHDIDLGRADGLEANIFVGVWDHVVAQGYVEAAKRLIPRYLKNYPQSFYPEGGADDMFWSVQDRIPLIISSRKHRTEMVVLLLSSAIYPQSVLDLALVACVTGTSLPDSVAYASTLLQLLEAGANASMAHGGFSLLSCACQQPSWRNIAVPYLLSWGATTNIDIQDENGQTALHHASGGDAAIVKQLLDAGASVNILDNEGHTPLWWAASLGSTPVLELLILQGASVDLQGENSSTPLTKSCSHNGIGTIRTLLDHGANVNARTGDSTPLLCAIRRLNSYTRTDIVDLLLHHGAAVVLDPMEGPQPFIEAVNRFTASEMDHVYVLFAAAKQQGREVGIRILERAFIQAMEGHTSLDVVGFLTTLGVDPTIRHTTRNESTILHLIYQWDSGIFGERYWGSTYREAISSTISLLVSQGGKVNATDSNGRTPLHSAVNENKSCTVKELLNNGADVEKVDAKGRTPLHLACAKAPSKWTRYTPWRMCEDLNLPQLSDPRMQGTKQFHFRERFRVEMQSMEEEGIIVALLKHGANPIALGPSDSTPLHLACRMGNHIAAGRLLRLAVENTNIRDRGHLLRFSPDALLTARDAQGRLPLHWAAKSGNIQLVRMILAPEYGTGFMAGRSLDSDSDTPGVTTPDSPDEASSSSAPTASTSTFGPASTPQDTNGPAEPSYSPSGWEFKELMEQCIQSTSTAASAEEQWAHKDFGSLKTQPMHWDRSSLNYEVITEDIVPGVWCDHILNWDSINSPDVEGKTPLDYLTEIENPDLTNLFFELAQMNADRDSYTKEAP